MTCKHGTDTGEKWRNCRCGATAVKCAAPERQHPKTPPLDHAGFHSTRVPGENGEPRSDYYLTNSLYCTAKHCRSYSEGG